MKTIFSTLILGIFATLTSAQDYCALQGQLCGSGTQHIGCTTAPGKWATRCTSPAFLDRNFAFIDLMIRKHNEIRNNVARGGLSNTAMSFPTASWMRTVSWDKELSDLACLNVQQCQMSHDACHNTQNWRYSGQNLAIQYASGPLNEETTMNTLVNLWIDEYKKVTSASLVDQCCGNYAETGHFTVMINELSHKIGCCAARFSGNGWAYNYLLACNYSFTNMLGQKIYTRGATGSSCNSGMNSVYPGLCSTNERFWDLLLKRA